MKLNSRFLLSFVAAVAAVTIPSVGLARTLPDKFLSYAEATGSQRVKLDYRVTGQTILRAKFAPTATTGSQALIFAGRGGISDGTPGQMLYTASGGKAAVGYYDKMYSFGQALEADKNYTCELGPGYATLTPEGGESLQVKVGYCNFLAAGVSIADGTGGRLSLFSRYRFGYDEFVGDSCKARLMYLRVYEVTDGAEELVREYLPCEKDGVVQFYETVKDAYFVPVGTLTGGAEITDYVLVSAIRDRGNLAPAVGLKTDVTSGSSCSLFAPKSVDDTSGRAVWDCAGYTVDFKDGTTQTGTDNTLTFSYSQPALVTWNYTRRRTVDGPVTWYVREWARDAAPRAVVDGSTAEKALFDIGKAVALAAENDTVDVGPGTYPLLSQLSLDKVVTLRSTDGAAATVLDAQNASWRVVEMTADATLDGFTLQRGKGAGSNDNKASGRGLRITAGTVSNCVIRANAGTSWCCGGGVYMEGGLISRCKVMENTCSGYNTAGIYMNGNGAVVEHSLVVSNTASATGTDVGGVYVNKGLVRNCTIVRNSSKACGGVLVGASGRLIDSIVWGNEVKNDSSEGAPNWKLTSGGKVTNVFSAVAFGVNASGKTLAGNPNFADFENGDYRLTSSSAGKDAAWGLATVGVDLDGLLRVSGPAMDLGCYEFDQSRRSASFGYSYDAAKKTVTVEVSPTGFDIQDADCYWTLDGTLPTPENYLKKGSPCTLDVTYGSVSIGCAVHVGSDRVYAGVKKNLFRVYPLKTYVVERNPNAEVPYNTWETAATNVTEALSWVNEPGSVVSVSNGTYGIKGELALNFAVTVRSVEGPERTVLDGELKNRLARLSHKDAKLLGFALQNGKDGTSNGEGGAGVVMSGGLVSNCVIRGCTMPTQCHGCGAYLTGGLMTGCVITNNAHPNWTSAGVCVYGGTLENSLVADNRLTSGNCSSAGVWLRSGTVRGCTIVNNSALAAPWGASQDAGLFADSIVWGNRGPNGAEGVELKKTSGTAQNICSSVAIGSVVGGYDLVGDPQFINFGKGDYRLRAASRCRDAASGNVGSSVDLGGRPRVLGKRMDIGCYECDQTGGMRILIR